MTQQQRLDPAIADQAESLATRLTKSALKPQTFFPGSTVAGFSPQELSAFDDITRSAGSSPLYDQARQYTSDVAAGDYLTGPQWNANVNAIMDPITARVNSQFGLAGRGGAPLAQAQIAKESARELVPMYGMERGMQQQAAASLPGLEGMKFADANAQLQAQAQMRQQRQAEINEQIARHQYAQGGESDRLAQALASITSGFAGTGVSQQMTPYSRNPTAGLMGGLMGGAAMGSMLPATAMGGYGIPIMMGLGAAGGLLG